MDMAPRNEILIGDALTLLRSLPSRSVQCIVTSPPYYALRDYGVEGQLGLEPTLEEYLDRMLAVFDELYRILKPTGVCWLNIGDSYAMRAQGQDQTKGSHDGAVGRAERPSPRRRMEGNLKNKDQMLVPFRLALALQAAGWWVRQTIIWDKPNPMPESVTDRCTQAHEYIFLLTRSERYYYDAEAIREPAKVSTLARIAQPTFEQQQGGPKDPKSGNRSHRKALENLRARADKQRGHSRRHVGFNDRWDAMSRDEQMALGANKRSVWQIATAPFPDAHYAVMPNELAETCILAGSRPGDIVFDPFMGSGTTAVVAAQHERDWLGIELNPDYAEMARRRIAEEGRPVVLKRKQRQQMRAVGVQQPSLLDEAVNS